MANEIIPVKFRMVIDSQCGDKFFFTTLVKQGPILNIADILNVSIPINGCNVRSCCSTLQDEWSHTVHWISRRLLSKFQCSYEKTQENIEASNGKRQPVLPPSISLSESIKESFFWSTELLTFNV